ncbi:SDR family oxidoreductase [Tsukamurella paurometabola]|uniref:3-oxoacyl-[acyl-carrier-protein] reductase FabG n=1 Tax=Tsukamurella paurometabola TaxID=2061 RepID=A0A3P8MBB8_TSUPA|nr:SDR family oxidoreductase [Tsukamurella paurometabola]MBS4101849.1 SDR family oxidoreductase [Tsukamurella paurometabola]UEA82160.1 SDR family oxidoreductase [Tsukamurella paurometabola]VDR39200.1 3-oxoacyl-[acyl-carrier-protein] reductase FabG [Tsukamurella paurometabola]
MAGPTAGLGLDGRVVVIAGAGPALGATLARRFADEAAHVVLVARNAERLEAMAAEITGAVAIPADITDGDSLSAVATQVQERFGRVDAVVNNAFTYPSMQRLVKTDPAHILQSVDLMALGALRTVLAFRESLAATEGAVVNVNSMVIRHSDLRYGGYKAGKTAQLALAQSLATELGPEGIRINSVVPGWIWGDTLRAYFEYRASTKGVTVEEDYADAAKNSDLRRLPTEDEVASAVLFLASPRASGITGQTLDVNCGEFHV